VSVSLPLPQLLSGLGDSLQSIDIRCAVKKDASGWLSLLTVIRISPRPLEEIEKRYKELESDGLLRNADPFRVMWQCHPIADIEDILKELGAVIRIDKKNGTVTAVGTEELDGREFDLSDTPDLLPVVAILSLKSRNPVRIYGVSHTRYKETNRLKIIASELRKLGVKTLLFPDEIRIVPPKKLKNARLDSHNDHRLFMSFVIAGMMTETSVVEGVESVDVSYPSFIKDMRKIGAKIN